MACFTGGECLDPKWSCLPCVGSPDYYTGQRVDGPFVQRVNKGTPGWYLHLAAPNTKGPNYAWLDPSPIYTFPKAFKKCVDDFVKLLNHNIKFQYIAAIDAMGLPLGAAIASRMHKGLICLRKERYLCVETESEGYGLVESEFIVPKRNLEIRTRPFPESTKVLCFDQWIESGSAMIAATNLIEKCGGEVVGVAALVIEDTPGSNELREKYKCLSCPISPELQEKFNSHSEEIFQVAWDVLAPGEDGDWDGRLPDGSEEPTPSVSPSTQIPISESGSPAVSREGSQAGDAPSKENSPIDGETAERSGSKIDDLTPKPSVIDTLQVPSKKSASAVKSKESSKATSPAVSPKSSITASQKSPTPSATSAKGSPKSPATSPKVSAPNSPKSKSPTPAASPASPRTPTPAASPSVSKNPTPALSVTPNTPSPAASPKGLTPAASPKSPSSKKTSPASSAKTSPRE